MKKISAPLWGALLGFALTAIMATGALAQTTTTTTDTTTTPGIPTTGEGGNALANTMLLSSSVLLFTAGFALTRSKRKV